MSYRAAAALEAGLLARYIFLAPLLLAGGHWAEALQRGFMLLPGAVTNIHLRYGSARAVLYQRSSELAASKRRNP